MSPRERKKSADISKIVEEEERKKARDLDRSISGIVRVRYNDFIRFHC